MVYQSLKFFTVRIGLSFFLLLTVGFFTLFFIHEVALPQSRFDDTAVQWSLLGLCLFFGFFAYGLVGEQRVVNGLHALKDAGPQDDSAEIIDRFEWLMDLTYSSYFLPGRGKFYRDQVVKRYADYLLSIGCEDPTAVRIYLKAFLLNPKGSRFRAPLLSSLTVGRDLSSQEIDLLLVMLEAEQYRDEFINNQLMTLFLHEKKLNSRTEPLFLNALESGHADSEAIINFVLPVFLSRQRHDAFALKFYLKVLDCKPEGDLLAKELIAKAYLGEYWKSIDAVLHEKCESVFSSLPVPLQQKLELQIENQRALTKLKKFSLFTREDRVQLDRLKKTLGITKSGKEILASGASAILRGVRAVAGKLTHKGLDGLLVFTRLSLPGKLILVAAFFMIVLSGISYLEWRTQQNEKVVSAPAIVPPLPLVQAPDTSKVYTVQIAAVTSPQQADRLVRSMGRKGVQEIYIVKAERKNGGYWYKIRFGRFASKDAASSAAGSLIKKNVIKNYFLIPLQEADLPKKTGRD